MIGYYPQPEPGELLYSTTARAAAMLYPGKRTAYVAERILGNGSLTFGGLFPNKCDLLLENIPPIAGITKQAVIDGSVYHLIAPLLSQAERDKLLETIFSLSSKGMRRWFTRSHTSLCYCVPCARRDFERGRPPVWRVLPNHPASSCCAEHGCRLTMTGARLNHRILHDPAAWIDHEVVIPESASTQEIQVARDLQCLYAQRSQILPGFQKVASAIRTALLSNPRYYFGIGQLRSDCLQEDLLAAMPLAVQRLDPSLLKKLSQWDSLLPTDSRQSIQRYSLFAQLLGMSFKELFKNAAALSDEALLVAARKRTTPDLIARYKRELADARRQRPDASRTEIRALHPRAVDVVLRKDPTLYAKLMPADRRGLSGNGRNRNFDWKSRDRDTHSTIEAISSTLSENERSGGAILVKAGLSRWTLVTARGRMPKTRALLQKIRMTLSPRPSINSRSNL